MKTYRQAGVIPLFSSLAGCCKSWEIFLAKLPFGYLYSRKTAPGRIKMEGRKESAEYGGKK
jgi:hypothetical protein